MEESLGAKLEDEWNDEGFYYHTFAEISNFRIVFV